MKDLIQDIDISVAVPLDKPRFASARRHRRALLDAKSIVEGAVLRFLYASHR